MFLTTTAVGEVLSSKFNGLSTLPVVLSNGFLADTHEVAAAKSAHLATTLSHQFQGYHGDRSYHGHTALPHVQHDGHIADTREVAAAKAEHFAAVASARAHGGYHHGADYSRQYSAGYDHQSGAAGAYHGYGSQSFYNGPLAKPVVLHDGYIADTQEVAAAKAKHFAAVAKARVHDSTAPAP